jgi:hypothetical protein
MDGLGFLRAGSGQGGSIAVRFSLSIGMVWVTVLQVGLHVCGLFLMNWDPPLTSGSMGFAFDDPGNG